MEQTFFKFDKKILNASERALERAEHSFARIEKNTEYNQQKVLAAFIENRVSESHFTETTGYGYGSSGFFAPATQCSASPVSPMTPSTPL